MYNTRLLRNEISTGRRGQGSHQILLKCPKCCYRKALTPVALLKPTDPQLVEQKKEDTLVKHGNIIDRFRKDLLFHRKRAFPSDHQNSIDREQKRPQTMLVRWENSLIFVALTCFAPHFSGIALETNWN